MQNVYLRRLPRSARATSRVSSKNFPSDALHAHKMTRFLRLRHIPRKDSGNHQVSGPDATGFACCCVAQIQVDLRA